MINKGNYTSDYICEVAKNNNLDISILERVVYAFGLLEVLAGSGLDFIFKGGTCLMLLFDHPFRFSTDIDIIVDEDTDMDFYIEEIRDKYPFLSLEEDVRTSNGKMIKRHFKFHYLSPSQPGKTFYILLDVVFGKYDFEKIVNKEIKCELIDTVEPYHKVKIPAGECMLGDKLTAFAPHTIGILMDTGKNMEIMKQFYDIRQLLNIVNNMDLVFNTYKMVVEKQMAYIALTLTYKDSLRDTENACLTVISLNGSNSEFQEYKKGVMSLANHLFVKKYKMNDAQADAARILLLVENLLKNKNVKINENLDSYYNLRIGKGVLYRCNNLKKVDLETFAYLYECSLLMDEE